MAIATLVEAFGVKDISPVRVKVYEKSLSKVPVSLLEPMVSRAIETRVAKCKDWLPAVADLLADAEACRRELVAANPYDGCCECEDGPKGWRKLTVNGYEYMQRCPCWVRYQEKLEHLGVRDQPLALPPAEPRELTRVGE
jgi:hypothetical protein